MSTGAGEVNDGKEQDIHVVIANSTLVHRRRRSSLAGAKDAADAAQQDNLILFYVDGGDCDVPFSKQAEMRWEQPTCLSRSRLAESPPPRPCQQGSSAGRWSWHDRHTRSRAGSRGSTP
jgi:hypothetical protein